MRRFLIIPVVLAAILISVASGIDVALERVSQSAQQSSFVVYNDRGGIMFAYSGDLATCRELAKPAALPRFLHRT